MGLNAEKLGISLGKRLSKSKLMERRLGRFDVEISGEEHLHDPVLKDRAFIVAGNHIIPTHPIRTSGVAPDGFVTANVISGMTSRKVSGIINFGYDLPASMKPLEKPLERFSKGMVEGLNAIPVNHVEGRNIGVSFLRELKKAISEKRIILVYPAGMYYEDFDPSQRMEEGTARIALKYGLPIVPFYAKNCNDWFKPNQDMKLAFGHFILPNGKTVEQINEEIISAIGKLQKEVKERNI